MRRALMYIVLLFPFTVQAEHLFEVGVHSGAAGWSSQPVYVQPQMGFNGGAQLYYNYLSPYVIGIRTGLTFECHTAGFGKLNYEDHYSTIDVENQQMDIDYTIGRLCELYMIWSVGVPAQLAISKKNVLLLAGAKAVFPINTTWQQTVEHASLSVYYPTYDNRVYESYPLAASRDFEMRQDGKLQLPKVQWWLTAELSYKILVRKKAYRYHSYLVVGAYADYCLTGYKPAQSDAESMLMLTDTRNGFPLQRILTPVMEANRQGDKLIRQCSLFDVGVKISYAIAPYSLSHRSYPCRCLEVW